ncbi:glycosyltransferase family 2 protein [Shewanella marina]|uniref:glycosyltransferase family 2 protein n=1 Tax=Shewanella marina TaxID=487319 RepID=UPI000A02A1F3|nr:glycosyltransferase family A protein [Shewanella marina]
MKISIIIPLYNKEDYIHQTLTSLLSMDTVDGIETDIIVIDDGSTDKSAELVNSIKSDKIHYFKKNNGGPSSARNFGILKSSADYIFLFDADDIIKSNALLIFNDSYKSLPNEDVYCFSYDKTSQHNNTKLTKSSIIRVNNFYKRWATGNFFCSSSIIINREFLLSNNLFFEENVRSGEDQLLWFKINEITDFIYNSQIIATYRDEIQTSITNSYVDLDINDYVVYLSNFLQDNRNIKSDEYRSIKKIMEFSLQRTVIANLKLGNRGKALTLLREYTYLLLNVKNAIRFLICFISPKFYRYLTSSMRAK